MRARNIKPGYFKNADFSDIPYEDRFAAKYLFAGLWALADCEGRLLDRPRTIRGELFAHDEEVGSAKVHMLLGLLADRGFIFRYSVGNLNCIEVRNFRKHQNPHIKERERYAKEKSLQVPEPQGDGPAPDQTGSKPGPDRVQTGSKPEPALLIPDSGFLTADAPKIKPPQQQKVVRALAVSGGDIPRTCAAIRKRFTTADMLFCCRVADSAVQKWISLEKQKIPCPGDDDIAEAVSHAIAASGQGKAGLLLTTVPAVIETWCLYGREPPGLPPPKRWVEPSVPGES